MAHVTLQNVEKIYPGKVKAVRDLNLTINDGEFIVLVGPSGCGKSTTLRMIAGLEEITSGTIHIGDRLINDVHPKDRDIAMVFQNYALYPHMTVYKNMAFALRLRKMPRAEIDVVVRDTAKTLGIEDLLNRKPKALSGGQRQRVAVGRAIVRDPKVFLFDEPLSNLDAKLRVEMRAELKRLHMRLQTTTVYVTHDQEEAMTLGDRVVVMNHAVIQQVGSPLEIYRKPINRFVAGFLGTPPMNFIEGQVVNDETGELAFREISMSNPLILPISKGGSHYAGLQAMAGENVTLGLRPEVLRPARDQDNAHTHPAVELEILVTEPLGDRMDVYLRTGGGEKIVARIAAQHAIKTGMRERFVVDMERVHFFEAGASGNRIGAHEATCATVGV